MGFVGFVLNVPDGGETVVSQALPIKAEKVVYKHRNTVFKYWLVEACMQEVLRDACIWISASQPELLAWQTSGVCKPSPISDGHISTCYRSTKVSNLWMCRHCMCTKTLVATFLEYA